MKGIVIVMLRFADATSADEISSDPWKDQEARSVEQGKGHLGKFEAGQQASSAMKDYSKYLLHVRESLQKACPDAFLSVHNVSFGPDGGGGPVIAVQKNYVNRIRELCPHFNIVEMSEEEYFALHPPRREAA